MNTSFAALIAAAIAFGTPVYADSVKYVGYSMSKKRADVKGSFIVDGYSYRQIAGFIAQDCTGKLGQMKLLGKPRNKRGHLIQKFSVPCAGGPVAAHKGSAVSIEVQQQPDGRNLVEIFGSDGLGNLGTRTEYR